MKKKLILLVTSFAITPFFLVFLIILFCFLNYQENKGSLLTLGTVPAVSYAALPDTDNTISGTANQNDARVEFIRQFFAKYKSELEPYSQNIVTAADKYNIDYRLLPSIAMQESNLCKKAPKGSYNCWGFGIYGKKVTKFENYEEAIDTVSRTLAKDYKDRGLETPEEIMKKYTPSNNGSWADSVNLFLNQLQLK